MDKDALLHKLQDELDKEKKYNEWMKYFVAYVWREDKDFYGKASNSSYELLTINQKGEEADERRKEILGEESKHDVSGEKNSKSGVDE